MNGKSAPVQIDAHNRILFYGSMVGYVQIGTAYADPLFEREELTQALALRKLRLHWQEGLYERLANGAVSTDDTAPPLKSCRIWQLRPEVEIGKKFIGYAELTQQFAPPNRRDYAAVYDGVPATNDLEALFAQFREITPPGFIGHALARSDVVELYDEGGSDFYYCDTKGFVPIFNQN